jgi:chorismate mutase/prephenate dehydratase
MNIEGLRKNIDSIDEKLVNLLVERLDLAAQIGQSKRESGQPVVSLDREHEVLENISRLASASGLDVESMKTVFRQIITLSRGTQAARVAYQGEPGAYSQQAAFNAFGHGTETVPMEDLEDVFHAVDSGETAYGVVPVENSLEGSISKTYDLLLESELKVAGEIELRVTHCLIVNPGTTFDTIRKVYSHPQALGQSQAFLKHMDWELVPTYDTAGSVKLIKERNITDGAAIASAEAARVYGMTVLSCALEDNPHNFTRFFILSRQDAPPTGRDKTSLVFSVKHKPGMLYRFLGDLAENGLNLTKIESRPTRAAPWEYNFYLDFEGHRLEASVKNTLCKLESYATFIKVLGSYPRAVPGGAGSCV